MTKCWLILWNIVLIGIVGVISANAGFVVESTLRGALQLGSDDMKWISISLIMMLGIILPLAVFLAQRYGYKRVFFWGTVVFLLGTLLNSFAFDYYSVLVARALGGIGAGALFPLSIAIIDKVFPKQKVALAITLYVGLVFGFGSSLGFIIGGYFVQFINWHAPFLLCLIVGIPSLFLTHFLHEETPLNTHLKFDKWGYIFFVTFIASILLILNSAKAEWNTDGWNSTFMWSCYVLACLSLAILVPLQLRRKDPLISFALFKRNSFLIGCIVIFFVGAPLYSTQILSVAFLDADLGYEKHTIGILLATFGITLGASTALTVFLSKIINVRILTLIGMGIITISCFLTPSISIYSEHHQYLWVWNLRMIGIGLSLGPATALALSELPPVVSGAAAVFITLFRQVGGTIGSLWTEVVTTQRNIFHQEMFGAQVESMAPAFQSTFTHLKDHLVHQVGALPAEAEALARALLEKNILTQAHVASIGDAFFLLGIATLLSCIGLILEMSLSSFKTSLGCD